MGGELEEDALYGLKRTSGYDLQKFIQNWLRQSGNSDKSVCEVIFSDPRFTALRSEVQKPASVFWSHIQKEDFLRSTLPQLLKMKRGGRLDNLEDADE